MNAIRLFYWLIYPDRRDLHSTRPRRRFGKKPFWIPISHGFVERYFFTLIAIPVLRGEVGKPVETNAVAGLLIAATIYLTLRERSQDFQRAKISVYSLWKALSELSVGGRTDKAVLLPDAWLPEL